MKSNPHETLRSSRFTVPLEVVIPERLLLTASTVGHTFLRQSLVGCH